MTSLEEIYKAFLSKMNEDDWATDWTKEEFMEDARTILDNAIVWFKFPRVSLKIEDDHFLGELNNEEIRIIATYMKCEWLDRTILTWENVKLMYDERDFSPANRLREFRLLLEKEQKEARRLEAIYYRSIKGRPFDYTTLAGGGKNER